MFSITTTIFRQKITCFLCFYVFIERITCFFFQWKTHVCIKKIYFTNEIFTLLFFCMTIHIFIFLFLYESCFFCREHIVFVCFVTVFQPNLWPEKVCRNNSKTNSVFVLKDIFSYWKSNCFLFFVIKNLQNIYISIENMCFPYNNYDFHTNITCILHLVLFLIKKQLIFTWTTFFCMTNIIFPNEIFTFFIFLFKLNGFWYETCFLTRKHVFLFFSGKLFPAGFLDHPEPDGRLSKRLHDNSYLRHVRTLEHWICNKRNLQQNQPKLIKAIEINLWVVLKPLPLPPSLPSPTGNQIEGWGWWIRRFSILSWLSIDLLAILWPCSGIF